MKKKKDITIQYTVRAVPLNVDEALRKNCVREGCSLNNYVVETLKKGAGLSDTPVVFHDLDFMAGTWVKDPVCEEALEEFNRIDEGMWT
jgi:hypothetical protein